jgi:hypothetical protein
LICHGQKSRAAEQRSPKPDTFSGIRFGTTATGIAAAGWKDGSIKIVDVETDADRKGSRERTVQRNIWEGALAAAKRVEKEFGKENLGPWTDFEWGMINGKLSALNWVMGEEWDMLDT